MNQPPHSSTPPQWRRPPGVAPGTWQYVHQGSIADRYDAFVAETPLCRVDADVLARTFPRRGDGADSGERVETILDLGCGTGRAAILLAQRGYDVVAIDLSQRMLEIVLGKSAAMAAANAHATSRCGRILPVRANLVQLECLASGSADHAICLFSTLGMIQGRTHRRAALRHVARIVRPGGAFLVHVHHRWAALREPGGTYQIGRSWVRSLGDRHHEFGDATYDYRGLRDMFMHRFSRRELTRDLKQSGWGIERWWRLSIDGAHMDSGPWIAGGFMVLARPVAPARRPQG